jgi:hypothetical protein
VAQYVYTVMSLFLSHLLNTAYIMFLLSFLSFLRNLLPLRNTHFYPIHAPFMPHKTKTRTWRVGFDIECGYATSAPWIRCRKASTPLEL